MILVDTSVWINLFSKSPNLPPTQEKLQALATCPPVIQEVLQGIKNDLIYHKVHQQFLALPCLSNPIGLDLYLAAGDIYRSARRQGFSMRSSMDCLIAAIGIQNKATIWHYDRDFDVIAKFTELQVISSL